VAISADGRLLAALGSVEAGIKLWALPEGRLLSDRFTGHDAEAYDVVFAPDGQHVVTGSRGGTIRIWDGATGRHVRLLEHGPSTDVPAHGAVVDLAFSPDGRQFVSCAMEPAVRLWDFASGRQIFRLPGHGRWGSSRTYKAVFAADGKRFFSFGQDCYLRIWNVENGKVMAEHAIRPSGVEVEETEEGGLRLVGESQGRDPFDDGHFRGFFSRVRFAADGALMLANDHKSLCLFDTASGREIDKLTAGDLLEDFHVSPDGRKLVTVETRRSQPDPKDPDPQPSQEQRLLKVYHLPSKEKVREIELAGTAAHALAFSADGALVATGIYFYKPDQPRRCWISVWDLETGDEVAHVDGYDNKEVHGAAFSPDGKRLASTHSDTTILVWDLGQFRVEGPNRD